MRLTSRNVLLTSVVLAATWGAVRIRSVGAQEESRAATSARGGLLANPRYVYGPGYYGYGYYA
jgi:hypothetical protein